MHDLIHGAIFILPCPIRGSVLQPYYQELASIYSCIGCDRVNVIKYLKVYS